MTLPLTYVSNGTMRRFNDNEVDYISHQIQQAYANQIAAGGQGHVYIGGAGVGDSTAIDSRRTAITNHPSSHQGTGVANINFTISQNRTNQATNGSWSPIVWNGTALQRDNGLLPEVFSHCLAEIRTGNELGSYRIATSSPGTGWGSQGVVFRDNIYSGTFAQPTNISPNPNIYYLYLKTGGVNQPGNYAQALIWNGTGLQRQEHHIGTNMMTNWLLPNFANWADGSLEYRFVDNNNPSNGLTNKGQIIDRRRSDTRNIMHHGDNYSSYPSGGTFNYNIYQFEVG